jgi:hypothetical protein
MMCGCTECAGLQTLRHSQLAKCGVMHCQIAINLGHCTRKARAEDMVRGWGDVGLHPMPLDAITVGTCAQWSAHAHAVPHWECQTLQCGNCRAYPVPAEEAREDAGAEDISFHVYEYKVSKRLDSKEQRRLELVQKRTKIAEFHCLYYLPALGRGQYHTTNLATQCRREQRAIERGSVSLHRNYGKRLALSFNKEIQSGYYQNTSVSVEGASLEWIDEGEEQHTRYFGHWSDNSKQDAASTTCNWAQSCASMVTQLSLFRAFCKTGQFG